VAMLGVGNYAWSEACVLTAWLFSWQGCRNTAGRDCAGRERTGRDRA